MLGRLVFCARKGVLPPAALRNMLLIIARTRHIVTQLGRVAQRFRATPEALPGRVPDPSSLLGWDFQTVDAGLTLR
jgi:hypothetical protein